MPILIQVCIVVLTIAIVVATIALVRVLMQLRLTAMQLEETLKTVNTTLPRLEQTLERTDDVLAQVQGVVEQANRIAGDVGVVGNKAARLSSMFVDQVAGPVTRTAALITGLKTGATFLVETFKNRRRSSTGGNHDE